MPGPRRGNQPMEKPKNAFSTVKRLAGYMTEHIFFIILVLIAIIFSALANVIGTSFLRTIIDQYLEPMVQNYTPELMAGFIATLVKMGGNLSGGRPVHLPVGPDDALRLDLDAV